MSEEPTPGANETNDGRPTGHANMSNMAPDTSLGILLPFAWPLFALMWLVIPSHLWSTCWGWISPRSSCSRSWP